MYIYINVFLKSYVKKGIITTIVCVCPCVLNFTVTHVFTKILLTHDPGLLSYVL